MATYPVKYRTTLEERELHIQAWQASGLTRMAYAEQQGINTKTFARWTLNAGIRKLPPLRIKSPPPTMLPVSMNVNSPPKVQQPAMLEVTLAHGTQLRIPMPDDPQLFSQLLKELMSCN